MHEQVQVDAITDSLEREEKQNALMDEKMEFFAAVEQGKLVLGDTLLHIAVRLGHEAIVDFLLLTDHLRSPATKTPGSALRPPTVPQSPSAPGFSGFPHPALALDAPSALLNTTQTPNFKGELPKDVVGSKLLIKLSLETVSDVHDVFGVAYKGEPKIHRMVGCLRRIWPLWMFEGQQEVANLVRVIYDTRSSDPAFGNLVKVSITVSERFRSVVSSDGDIQAARHTLASEWTSEQKRQLLFEIFKRWFRTWKWRRHDERDTAYVQFFDAAMDAWLQLVQDLQLHRVGDSKNTTSNEHVDARVDAGVLKRYELQIWKRRMHPPFTYMEDLCAHLTALESHLELAHLKA
ncbi:hypothetical protein FI667_g1538, partial [Globisporangium splendens]